MVVASQDGHMHAGQNQIERPQRIPSTTPVNVDFPRGQELAKDSVLQLLSASDAASYITPRHHAIVSGNNDPLLCIRLVTIDGHLNSETIRPCERYQDEEELGKSHDGSSYRC